MQNGDHSATLGTKRQWNIHELRKGIGQSFYLILDIRIIDVAVLNHKRRRKTSSAYGSAEETRT